MGELITERDVTMFYQRLARIQNSMQGYLERYICANRLPLRADVIEQTFGSLISGEEPATSVRDLVAQYVDILASNKEVIDPFKVGIAIKVTILTSSGMGPDAMRILRQLNHYNIHAFQLDTTLPALPDFIK